MSAAIDKCYWYGSIILPTSAFSFDCSIKIWPRCSCVDSIMHSTRTFVIIVSNDRVPCRPHLDHLAAAVIVARAPCYLTAADHCYVMFGIIKFGDKSINDSSARWLDHRDVIASCSEVRRAAQQSWTPNRDQIIYSSSFGVNHKPTRELHSWSPFVKCSRSVYAPHLVQSVLLPLFKEGVSMVTGFPKMVPAVVQRELCGTNFREDIANFVW